MVEREEVTEAIQSVLNDWGVTADTARGVNEGECMELVNQVLLETDLNIERRTTEDLPTNYIIEEDGFKPEPYHEWLTDGDYHYDAEVPQGVPTWKGLPFFKRSLGVSGD